jgi:hypothetical protein
MRQYLGVAFGLAFQDSTGLGAAIKLKEQMQSSAAGKVEDAVAIRDSDAAEKTGESTDAVPLRERSARATRLDSETDEELVAFDVVREVPACGEAERVGTAVVQLVAVNALVIGDKDRSAFIRVPSGTAAFPRPAFETAGIGRARATRRAFAGERSRLSVWGSTGD